MHVLAKADLEVLLTHMFTPRRLERPPSIEPVWTEAGTSLTARGPLAFWAVGSGAVVLLVHGWEGTHADMSAFVAPLLARDYRVVTFDNFAHGKSGCTEATLVAMSEGVRAIGDRFGPLAGIIAHSVGGPATAMALHDGLRAKRVALVSAPTRYEDFVRQYSAAVGVAPETLLDELARRGFEIDALDLPTIAERLDVPALIVHSQDDRVTAAAGSERIAAAWRGSRLVRVDGLGHNRILRDEATIETIVDFVTA